MEDLLWNFDWSWPAAVFTLGGRWLLGRKKISGWVVEIVAGLFWHWIAYSHQIWGQLVMSIILQGMNVRGLILWTKARRG